MLDEEINKALEKRLGYLNKLDKDELFIIIIGMQKHIDELEPYKESLIQAKIEIIKKGKEIQRLDYFVVDLQISNAELQYELNILRNKEC